MIVSGFWKIVLISAWAGICVIQPSQAFFGIFSPPDPPPAFTAPADGSRFSAGSFPPSICWTEVSGVVLYELQFALESSFGAPFTMECTDACLNLASLMDQDTWDDLSLQLFLRVRGMFEDESVTGWSEGIEFAKTVAAAPGIVSPVDDARYVPGEPMPVFEWYSDTPVYRFAIEFGLDPEFNESFGVFEIEALVLDCNLAGDAEAWDPIIGTYYWRIWGLEYGWIPTPSTPARSFSKTVCETPALLAPADRTRYPDFVEPPFFEWIPPEHDSGEYHIQFVYGQDDFPAGGRYIRTTDTWFTFESVGITDEMWHTFYGKLSWRVAALDRYGNHGGFSKAFWFTKISAWNYMAFGDSVTGGWGSSDFETGFAGYPRQLQQLLRARYSNAIQVFCRKDISWFSGCHAYTGSANIARAMEYHGPQHALIMLGIVDIVDPGASGCDNFDCRTIEHLTAIIDIVQDYRGIPYLATLPPVNPDSPRAFLQGAVDELNADIRELADIKNVRLAELDTAFFNAPLPLPDYFSYDAYNNQPDWAHFNDLGYLLIAETWNQLL